MFMVIIDLDKQSYHVRCIPSGGYFRHCSYTVISFFFRTVSFGVAFGAPGLETAYITYMLVTPCSINRSSTSHFHQRTFLCCHPHPWWISDQQLFSPMWLSCLYHLWFLSALFSLLLFQYVLLSLFIRHVHCYNVTDCLNIKWCNVHTFSYHIIYFFLLIVQPEMIKKSYIIKGRSWDSKCALNQVSGMSIVEG